MSDRQEVVIGWLYPTLMSTYGDRGNAICLQRRCQWHGFPVQSILLARPGNQTNESP